MSGKRDPAVEHWGRFMLEFDETKTIEGEEWICLRDVARRYITDHTEDAARLIEALFKETLERDGCKTAEARP